MSSEKKAVRAAFRAAVFTRDKHRCAVCGVAEAAGARLDAHHIIDRHALPAGGYVAENGISLCDAPGGCHEKAERAHQGQPAPPGFSADELFARIGSSSVEALAASERLARRHGR